MINKLNNSNNILNDKTMENEKKLEAPKYGAMAGGCGACGACGVCGLCTTSPALGAIVAAVAAVVEL